MFRRSRKDLQTETLGSAGGRHFRTSIGGQTETMRLAGGRCYSLLMLLSPPLTFCLVVCQCLPSGSATSVACNPLKYVEGQTSEVNCALSAADEEEADYCVVICSSDPDVFTVSMLSRDADDGGISFSAGTRDDGDLVIEERHSQDLRNFGDVPRVDDLRGSTSRTTERRSDNRNLTFWARGEFLGFAELIFLRIAANESTYIEVCQDHATEQGFQWSTGSESSCSSIRSSIKSASLPGSIGSYEPAILGQQEALAISVVRPDSALDTIFTTSVIVLVTIAYVNMGCTLDLAIVKDTLRRPKGPAVGLACQYIFMPVMAYCLGLLLLDSPSLRLALFVVGCSPGGGASNIWTVLLDGNVNLSITMTFVSSIVSMAAMPLWVFTLGRSVAEEGDNLRIPYSNVALSAFSFVIPAVIGVLLARKWPKAGKWLVKGLKPFGAFFLLYALTFGIYVNVYAVKLLTWKVAIAPLILIWSGYACGAIVSRALLRFPSEDVVAVALETGIQNTGVAFVVLEFSIGQPSADLSLVIIFMSSMTMVVPPLATYGLLKLLKRRQQAEATNSKDIEMSSATRSSSKWGSGEPSSATIRNATASTT